MTGVSRTSRKGKANRQLATAHTSFYEQIRRRSFILSSLPHFSRYYGICEKLDVLHVDPGKISKPFVYDAEHERKRKEQLRKLYDRTQEQVEEEDMLKSELRKIEARKREREKKAQDLQKLINQADIVGVKTPNSAMAGGGNKSSKKKQTAAVGGGGAQGRSPAKDAASAAAAAAAAAAGLETAGIRFPDTSKTAGVTLRSQRMKLPPSVGQKKSKAIEQMLQEIAVDLQPMPTDEISTQFNELRSDMVLLYELKNALSTCQLELQSLKAQFETLCPGKSLEIPEKLRLHATSGVVSTSSPSSSSGGAFRASKNISDVIDVVGNGATPPMRKRKAALEQSNVLKKIKNKNF
jgi:DNA methyltransferase 1-associated protein 1